MVGSDNIRGVDTLLTTNKMDLNDRNSVEMYLLPQYIVSNGMLDILIHHGLDVTRTSRSGENMLFWCASVPVLTALLRMGLDVNCRNREGKTVLYHHLDSRSSEMVITTLLQHGANPLIPSTRGLHPLHIATSSDIQNLLIDHGTDPNIIIDIGIWTPSLSSICVNVVKMKNMVERGLDPKRRDWRKRSLIHDVACMNIYSVTEYMVGMCDDIDMRDVDDNTPLHIAAHGHRSLLCLLEHGASVNVVNKDGDTPLIIASRCGNPKGVEILLQYGADPYHRNRERRTAYNYARDECRRLLSPHFSSIFSIERKSIPTSYSDIIIL